MSESMVFNGKPCCVFYFDTAKTAYDRMDMEFITDYGDVYYNPDGTVRHYLYTWDDGSRTLVKCKKCGALFLVQRSEYHGPEDSYYTDWYQVESAEAAEQLNATFGGFGLERNYEAPWIKTTNSSITWNKNDIYV